MRERRMGRGASRRARAGRVRKEGFFSIPLRLQKVEMIRWAGPMTDRQAMANGFGKISLGCLDCIVHRFALCEMGRDCRGEGTASAMRVEGIDEFPFEHIEESAVIEQISGAICRQMASLDQHMLTTESVNNFGSAPGIRESLDFNAG